MTITGTLVHVQKAIAPGTVAVRCSPREAPRRKLWFQAAAQWWAVVPCRLQADSYGSRHSGSEV